MPRPKVDILREPDHLASAGKDRGARIWPAGASMARLLSGFSNFTLESTFKTSGTISTTARIARTSLFALQEPERTVRSDRFSSHKGFRVTRNTLKKSTGIACARIASRNEPPFVACTVFERRLGLFRA